MSVNNAQSGRAAAIARRKAQVNGKGQTASAAPAASRKPEPAPEPVVAAAPAPSQPSRNRRPVPAATPPVASSAGREAAKLKRQQQKNGKSSAGAASAMPHPKAKAKQKPAEPIVEPRQAKAEKPAKRSERRTGVKPQAASQPSGRLQSKAYRKAQAKGKVGQEAFKSKGSSQSGAKAKLANPDASTREIAQQVRAERCAHGKTCSTGGSRRMRKPRKAQDAPPKVGESETLHGQSVSGTQVGQGEKKMTGAEYGACQLVSGTEYLGVEEFSSNCDAQPTPQPAKVTQTQTTRGQVVSGSTNVGRGGKMTGNETGTCSAITGTEYLPADQSQMFCGATPAKTTATGFSVMSQATQKNENKVTGGDSRKSQSTTINAKNPAKAPRKVMPSQTSKGNTTTGSQVGRLESVTGGDKGNCQSVTGTGYQGVEEVQACDMPVAETANKVTASGTSGGQKVTGDRSGAYYGMTGAEAGDCQAVTGTAYTGSEQSQFCSVDRQNEMKVRQRQGKNSSISGVQPGPQGLTGAQKGACELVTGAHYQGGDQTAMVCDSTNAAASGESDFPAMIGQAQPAVPMNEVEPMVDDGSRITGDGWDRGSKVTGTDGPWAAQRNASIRGVAGQSPMGASQFRPADNEIPMSPITGSSGNTDTGAKVTLSGGARA
ncbi:CsoS2 family carboxysome shell protein [Hydrogenovibrio sp. 3SP14C1]|uniref:carboxysome assembly protein CsoS2 n=1 Tax=Hydrogenovibrio sp. 3SP14C1 TaxID=3038774 RepID=UPI00241646D8|nr:CsoS2 family carboxysome shell protein [Hydrogenovibrio sp. 3SP14C1]MDG4812013.1 CsoS2 family carboxysome shell protein [Hydrogenovibrio sp. 3SP14C1]